MKTPLTQEQSAFAAEHHNLVYSFLNKKRYSEDEFYDIVIFGYLLAVRVYLEREDLQAKYKFSTIAYARMRSAISNHFRSESCPSRRADICRYDENIHSPQYTDSVWEIVSQNYENETASEKLPEVLTNRQLKAAVLKTNGCRNSEIGAKCGHKPFLVDAEIQKSGESVRNYAPELMDLLAA